MLGRSLADRHWQRRTLLSDLLLIPALLYGGLVALRRAFYRIGILRQRRLPVPVIVVGNFTVGGTGKTPLTVWLAQHLRAAGYRPGIVTRGYGGQAHGIAAVSAEADPRLFGDEPVLMARESGCPVWRGADRHATGQALLAAEPQVDLVLLDDGLQHLALARDIEIALFDERGAGNGRLLPAGPLREAPRAVDLLVRNGARCAPGELAMTLRTVGLFDLYSDAPVAPLELTGQRLHAVAGIGNPSRFFASVRALGLSCIEHALADHHDYRVDDLPIGQADVIIVTEKDAVKLRRLARIESARVVVLRVQAEAVPELMTRLIERLRILMRHG